MSSDLSKKNYCQPLNSSPLTFADICGKNQAREQAA